MGESKIKFENRLFINWISENRWFVGLLILLTTLLWGYSWALMKAALEFMGPFTFSAFRFGVGTITMLLILVYFKISRPTKKQLAHLVVVGILQTSVVFLLVMYGLKFVDAGKSSVLLYSMPIWSSLLAAMLLKEKIPYPKVIGLSIGLLGLMTILGWDLWLSQNAKIVFGEFMIVLAAISWGASNVYYRMRLKELSQLQVNSYQMLFGTIGIILVSLIVEGGDSIVINLQSVYYILFTGLFASALCFTIWFILLSVIDMVTATISTLLVPVFGLVFGWFLLDEQLTASVTIGSLLIIIGIIMATGYQKIKKGLSQKS
ncbi:DMT family transporter [Alkalibacillus aidingensis]|uniref:DMT family transporter n=1 Tax=Alkalibacillus aidingensis TaxID=2747607 RepID=UPI0016600EC8|nr:DMT family transporter [Alkalibacillus aidingensis]